MHFLSPNVPQVDNSSQAETRRINRDYEQLLLIDLQRITHMSLEDIVHKFNEGWRLVSLEDIAKNHIQEDRVIPPIPFKDGTIIVR